MKEEELTGDVKELFELMSDISEDACFAGWYYNFEFILWNSIITENYDIGMCGAEKEKVLKAKELSDKLNGWIYWPNLPTIEDDGINFVSLDEWIEIFNKSKWEQ